MIVASIIVGSFLAGIAFTLTLGSILSARNSDNQIREMMERQKELNDEGINNK